MKSQLSNENISFISTSQNVGYDFDDVPTLIHSWMNSDMHRSRMLNTKYEEMGGEVMKDYYSLIFLKNNLLMEGTIHCIQKKQCQFLMI